MADETKEEKTKQTVPGMARTFKGVAGNAEIVRGRWWDAERKTWTHPYIPTLALFAYTIVMAELLNEAEERTKKERAAFEKRIAEFETRITTMERWVAAAEAQTAEMVKGVEDLMSGGESAVKEHLRQIIDAPPLKVIKAPAVSVATVSATGNTENGTEKKPAAGHEEKSS